MRGDGTSAGKLLEGIVAKSVSHNLQVGVSGHLCYDAKLQKVWQVIEGSPDAVGAIWERVSKDDRHIIDEDTVEVEPVEARRYPLGWGLRYSGFERADGELRETQDLDVSKCAIIQLAYKSYICDQEMGETEVMQTILPHAMVKNAKAGITGWLLYNDRTATIYQILEGPPESVERLWDRIRQDPRHKVVDNSVTRRAVKVREFPNWSMAANEVAQSHWATQSY